MAASRGPELEEEEEEGEEGRAVAGLIADATRAFDAYAARGQTQFAGDAVMMRGQSHEALGRLQDALRDYDRAYDCGHPTGYAMGDNIRERIAVEDPNSAQAAELLEKVLQSRTGADDGRITSE